MISRIGKDLWESKPEPKYESSDEEDEKPKKSEEEERMERLMYS